MFLDVAKPWPRKLCVVRSCCDQRCAPGTGKSDEPLRQFFSNSVSRSIEENACCLSERRLTPRETSTSIAGFSSARRPGGCVLLGELTPPTIGDFAAPNSAKLDVMTSGGVSG